MINIFYYFYQMTLVVNPKNKQQEKVIKAFMQSQNIHFYTEEEEDAALQSAMQKGRKTALVNENEKQAFISQLKNAE